MKTRQNRRTQARKSQSRRRGGSGGSGGSLSHRRGSKSRRRGGSELSRRRGGSGYFYPYNTKPMIFTNTTSQQGGDARDTVLPSFITNMGRDAIYQVGQTYNAFVGNYSSVNPTPTEQNLFKR